MTMKHLLLFLFIIYFFNCGKKVETSADSSVNSGVAPEFQQLISNKDKFAVKDGNDSLLNNAIFYTLSDLESAFKSNDKNDIDIATKIFNSPMDYIKVTTNENDIAIVSSYSLQGNSHPMIDMKIFYFNSKNWEPVSIDEKNMKYEMYDINGDGTKDILGQGGCCGNLALVMSMVHKNIPPDISNSGFFHAVIEPTGKYELFKKGSCENFYVIINDHDRNEKKEIKTKVTYDCKEGKFNEEGI
jgi:hypothetical protein